MASANYKPETTGELTDVPAPFTDNYRRISIGNCVVDFDQQHKTFSFMTSGDDEWPIKSAENFSRIMDYILVTYGR